jgi:hypothetical protein
MSALTRLAEVVFVAGEFPWCGLALAAPPPLQAASDAAHNNETIVGATVARRSAREARMAKPGCHTGGDKFARVALRKLLERLTPKPIEQVDREKLEKFRAQCDGGPLDSAAERSQVRAAGEVRSVRIVPRAGAAALEVLVNDGSGSVTGVFLGRRKIAGMSPGRRVVFEGLAVRDGRRLLLYNPIYELH